MPNGTGIVMGFPQILSEATAVKAAFRDRIRATRRARTAAERAGWPARSSVSSSSFRRSRPRTVSRSTRRRPPSRRPHSLRETLRHLGVAVLLPLVRPERPGVGVGTTATSRPAARPRRAPSRRAEPRRPRGARRGRRPRAGARRRHARHPARSGRRALRRRLPLLDRGSPSSPSSTTTRCSTPRWSRCRGGARRRVDGALTPLRCLRLPGAPDARRPCVPTAWGVRTARARRDGHRLGGGGVDGARG